MTVGELVARFLSWTQANRTRKTWEFYTHQLSKLPKAALKLEVKKFTSRVLLEVKINFHLVASCKRVFNWGRRVAGLIRVNPLADYPLPRVGQRKRILSPREAVRLLRAGARDFRDFVLALRETAARPQEVRNLAWSDIRYDHGARHLGAALVEGRAYFYLPEHKARTLGAEVGARVIPISPRLGRLLARLGRGGKLDGEIFRTGRGRSWTKNALVCRMKRLRDRLPWLKKRFGEQICLYTWRHTTGTAWAAAGVNGKVLGELMGHVNPETTARYLHLNPDMLRGALARLWRPRRGGSAEGN